MISNVIYKFPQGKKRGSSSDECLIDRQFIDKTNILRFTLIDKKIIIDILTVLHIARATRKGVAYQGTYLCLIDGPCELTCVRITADIPDRW